MGKIGPSPSGCGENPFILGMVEGEPVISFATKVGDVYMGDPQTWIPQN